MTDNPFTNASQDFLDLNPGLKGQQISESKYHNQRTEYGGVIYQSKHEAKAARDLDLQVKAGEIDFYLRQVPFSLGGIPEVRYKADFMTFKVDTKIHLDTGLWRVVVIEAKGMWTAEAKLKLKLFRAKYPSLKIEVV